MLRTTLHKIKIILGSLIFKMIIADALCGHCNTHLPKDFYACCRNILHSANKFSNNLKNRYFAVECKYLVFVAAPFSLLRWF